MRALWIFFSLLTTAHATEVIKPEFHRKIELRIVRAEPDSFETYTLMNHNGREMVLVCANNRVYDNNPRAFIEYRNYYNEIAGNFTIDNNIFCKEMGKFIENISARVSEENPFVITLDTRSMKVTKLVYPNVDPFADTGSHRDLLPRGKNFCPGF